MTRWVPRGKRFHTNGWFKLWFQFWSISPLYITLSCAKVNSWQICGCVNNVPKVPAIATAITHPFSGVFPLLCSDSRGQTDSCCCCCCYFLSLGTAPILRSQFPSREDGVSLSRGGSSRWYRISTLCFHICTTITLPYVMWLQKPEEKPLNSHTYLQF